MILKTCKKCGEDLSLENFHKLKGAADGLDYRCKACKKKIKRKDYLENKEKINEQNSDNYYKNREERLVQMNAYNDRNREEKRRRDREYQRRKRENMH